MFPTKFDTCKDSVQCITTYVQLTCHWINHASKIYGILITWYQYQYIREVSRARKYVSQHGTRILCNARVGMNSQDLTKIRDTRLHKIQLIPSMVLATSSYPQIFNSSHLMTILFLLNHFIHQYHFYIKSLLVDILTAYDNCIHTCSQYTHYIS